MTKEKVLLASASGLFRGYKDDMTDGDVVNALSSGIEFEDVLKGSKIDGGLGKIEQRIRTEIDASTTTGLSAKDQDTVASYDGVRRKAAALLWTYLGRLRVDTALDDGLYLLKTTMILRLLMSQRNTKSLRLPINYSTLLLLLP